MENKKDLVDVWLELYDEFGENNYELIEPDNYDFITRGFDLIIQLTDKSDYVISTTEGELNAPSLLHPILYEENFFISDNIIINLDYYIRNKEQIDTFILNLVADLGYINLYLDKRIINEKLLELIKNMDLKSIELGNSDEPYVLKEADLKYLKHIKDIRIWEVEEKLKDNIPSYLGYKLNTKLVGDYDFHKLNTEEILYFGKKLTDEEIRNLKYIGNQVKTIIFLYKDYDNIFKAVSKLPNIQILIFVKDKKDFPFKQFEQFDNITLGMYGNYYPVKRKEEQEEKLESLVREIKNSNLSPLERYLAVYDIVKKFKKYNENLENFQADSELYAILSNEYIVCQGFTNLLEDLLERVGIKSLPSVLYVILDEKIFQKTDEWHSRLLVYLNDSKYNLKGYFIADPTYDNEIDDEYYNHALLTPHEREIELSMVYSIDDVYGVDTQEELEKILTRKESLFHQFNSVFYGSNSKLDKFIDNTRYFDLNAYKELFPHKQDISDDELIEENDMLVSILAKKSSIDNSKVIDYDKIDYEKIFNYIKENTCKEIKGTTIIDAAMEVYKFKNPNYTIEEYQNYRQKLIKSNFERQEKAFPKLERYNDETYEVIGGEHNKFSR